MKQSESVEMYLETIYVLQNRKVYVRSVDIAEKLGVSKPSVSIAIKKLKENGYIADSETGHVILSEKGKELAERTYEKHQVLKDMFIAIGAEPRLAEETACRMEHVASMELIEIIKQSLECGKLSDTH